MLNNKNNYQAIHFITSLNIGGAEGALYNYLKNTNSANLVVCLLDVGFYGKKLNTESNHKVIALNFTKSIFKNIFQVHKIYKIIKNNNCSKIYCWMYHSCFLLTLYKLFFKIKLIWMIRHGNPNLKNIKIRTFIIIYLLSYLKKQAYKIVYCSKKSKMYHENFGFYHKNSFVIENGYDEKKFFYNKNLNLKNRNKYSINKGAFILGIVARFHPIKNHSFFFKIAFLLKKILKKNLKIFIIGKDINQNNKILNEMINKYNLQKDVFLIEKTESINAYYNTIDCLLLTSKDESFPNVLCEAQMTGLRCFSTDVGAAKEIINSDKYIINYDPKTVRDNILNLYDKNEFLKTKKNVNSLRNNIISRYSIQKMTQKINDL